MLIQPRPSGHDSVIYESVRDPVAYVAAYNELMRQPTNRLRIAAVVDTLSRIDGPIKRVVDVASGGGAYTAPLRERVPALRSARFVAVDRQFACVHGYRLNHSSATAVVADVTGLPFAEGIFDLALCLDIIEHLDDDAAFLRGVGRLLRPGGWIAIATHNSWSAEHALGLLTSAARKRKWLGWDPTHVRFYNARTLRQVLGEGGFEDVDFDGTYYVPFHLPARVASWPWARAGFGTVARTVYELVQAPGYAINGLFERISHRGPMRVIGWGIIAVARKRAS